MSQHSAQVLWQRRNGEHFVDQQYSRAHTWLFDGGASVAASSSPDVVPPPCSVGANVDPEEAFVAAVASCHMLWFLGLAAKRRLVVDSYRDRALGLMRKDAQDRLAITDIILRPDIVFGGDDIPDEGAIRALHESAHRQCFIANSVKAAIRVEKPDYTHNETAPR